MKHLFHLALLALTLFFWKGFADKGGQIEELQTQLEKVEDLGDPKDEAEGIKGKVTSVEGERLMLGMLLTIFSCVVAGIFVWAYLLPYIAQRATHAIYDSGEVLEKDKMREAHSWLAQGEYEAAMEAFRKVADEDPLNRLPWVEMTKIHRHNLHDANAAIEVLREALESHEWPEDDAAFLMFRMAETYDEDLQDRVTGRAIMQQIIDSFPESRHSANATHKLHEWHREDEEKALMGQLHSKDSGGNPQA